MPTPRRTKYIDQAVTAALRDIRICEAAIVAFDFAKRVMDNRALGYGTEVQADPAMRLQLYKLKSDAQSRAMMFGALTLNEELRKAATKAATEFIMRDHASIMGYLMIDGVPPSRYLVSVDEEFRAEIRAAVKDVLGVDPDEDDRLTWGAVEDEDEPAEDDDVSGEDDDVEDEEEAK